MAGKRMGNVIAKPASASPIGPRISTKAQGTRSDEADTISALRMEAKSCRRCPLWEPATQTIFGEGPDHAAIMFVGEQPGDKEDLAGKPFVGPAGQVLDHALEKVGIDRSGVYVTNVVKHFKYEPRGKMRLHKKPNTGEINQCRFWLDRERALIHPSVIVALGASAIQGLLGRAQSIRSLRGRPVALDAHTTLFATVHPSYLLRLPDPQARESEQALFEADLAAVQTFMRQRGTTA